MWLEGKNFSSIFDVWSLQEIALTIQDWTELGYGWNTDELMLYSSALWWEQRGGNLIRLGHNVGPRLDRGSWRKDFSKIDVLSYIDVIFPALIRFIEILLIILFELYTNNFKNREYAKEAP